MQTIDFQTEPSRYRHWRIECDGDVAYLIMDVDQAGGLFDGYELKLNSYDLGVDIELNDAVQRLRFEHPEVRCVVIKSGKDNVFCAGANIRMLGKSTHGHKVNFCKFTNETRLAIEDASREFQADLYLRHQRQCRRRRLRTGARRRPHHAGRRPPLGGGAAGNAAARRAAGHRRAHPRHRQAQGAARPRRRVLLDRGRHPRRQGGRMAAGRRGGAQFEMERDGGRARARDRRALRPAEGRQGHRADAARAQDRSRPRLLFACRCRDRPRARARHHHRARAVASRAGLGRSRACAGRQVLAAHGGARTGRRHPASARQRAAHRRRAAAHRRQRAGRARSRRLSRQGQRRLADARDPPLPQARAQARRRDAAAA